MPPKGMRGANVRVVMVSAATVVLTITWATYHTLAPSACGEMTTAIQASEIAQLRAELGAAHEELQKTASAPQIHVIPSASSPCLPAPPCPPPPRMSALPPPAPGADAAPSGGARAPAWA